MPSCRAPLGSRAPLVILVLASIHCGFILFTFVHCDHDHDKQEHQHNLGLVPSGRLAQHDDPLRRNASQRIEPTISTLHSPGGEDANKLRARGVTRGGGGSHDKLQRPQNIKQAGESKYLPIERGPQRASQGQSKGKRSCPLF